MAVPAADLAGGAAEQDEVVGGLQRIARAVGLVTRLINRNSDELKNADARGAQLEEMKKIEKETMDGDEFRAMVGEFATIPDKDRSTPILN